MNQDQTKELLLKLCPEAPDFQVVYSGKSSKRINGRYSPDTREIYLHNKNFSSDQELVYTAVHEFAHHLHFCSDTPPALRTSHNLTFKVIFRDLMAKAIEAGIYRPVQDQEFLKAIEEVRAKLREEAEATKRTGQALLALVQQCGKFHQRFEDVLDRDLGMKPASAKLAMAAFAQDVPVEAGPDNLRLMTQVKNPEVRRELAVLTDYTERKAALKKVELPKITAAPAIPDPVEAVKARLEAKVVKLEKELTETKERLEALATEPAAAHRVFHQVVFDFGGVR